MTAMETLEDRLARLGLTDAFLDVALHILLSSSKYQQKSAPPPAPPRPKPQRMRHQEPLNGVVQSQLLNLPEVAAQLKVSLVTVKRLVSTGVLVSVKIGKRRLVRTDAIDDYLNGLSAPTDAA